VHGSAMAGRLGWAEEETKRGKGGGGPDSVGARRRGEQWGLAEDQGARPVGAALCQAAS
jgi:hypothetical protein